MFGRRMVPCCLPIRKCACPAARLRHAVPRRPPGSFRAELKVENTVIRNRPIMSGTNRWHNHQSIPRKSTITPPLRITMRPPIIIIRPSTTTREVSTQTLRITQTRRMSTANKLINTRRRPALILKNRRCAFGSGIGEIRAWSNDYVDRHKFISFN